MKRTIFIIFFTILTLALFSVSTLRTDTSIYMTGTISVAGNEPFTYLIIRNANISYSIVGDMRGTIWNNYQGRTIKVKGAVLKETDLMLHQLDVTEIIEVIE